MNLFRRCFNFSLFWVLIYTNAALATEVTTKTELKSLCAIAKAQEPGVAVVALLQHEFDGGVQDIAMAVSNESGLDIKRVTFGGSTVPECHYNAMALARGGDWGWHLVWITERSAILSYARMDGEAWVSSPTKKLGKEAHVDGQPLILTFEQKVWIVWQGHNAGPNKVYAVYSDDEGRSWHDVQLLMQTSSDIGHLRLNVKEGRPSLLWGEKAEVLPLPE